MEVTTEATTDVAMDKAGMSTGGTVNLPENLPVNPSVNLPVELSTTAKKIYHLLKEDGKYTYDRLSEAVGVTRETVRVSIRSLVEANLIRRIGPDKTGHWEVGK
jgi:predicted HTH transcriptional regulator